MTPFKSSDLLLVYGSSPGDLHRYVHVFYKPRRLFVGYCLVGRSGSCMVSSNPYCDDCLGAILSSFSVRAYNSSQLVYYNEEKSSNEALARLLHRYVSNYDHDTEVIRAYRNKSNQNAC